MSASEDQQERELQIDPALSPTVAKELSTRFRARLRSTIEKALGDEANSVSDERKSALFSYAMRAAHARKKVNAALIKEAQALSDEELAQATRQQPTAFTLREAVTLIKEAEGKHGERHAKMFKPGQYRKYYQMPQPRAEDLGRTGQQIIRWLENEGYTDIDYIAGTCIDDRKQTRRIGRCLPDEQYKQAFANDPDRQGGNLMMVISRHPYDLIRMSTGRGWQSCMTKNGMYWEYVPKEVKEGSMVAYLIKKSDPEILDPMSRSTIKPFYNDAGDTLMMAGPTYGMGSGAFKAAVQAVIDREFNAGVYGNFTLPRTVYDDGLRSRQRRIDPGMKSWSAEQWIKHLALEVEQQGDRKVIKGDLNLAHYELEQLPDFTAYDVDGNMMLDGNKLTALGKLPQKVTGNFTATNNKLLTIVSTLQEVGGNYAVDNNRIGSLIVGPQKVGGAYSARNNRIDDMSGLPEVLEGDLILYQNQIKRFGGDLKHVKGNLYMQANQLETLAGMPMVGTADQPKAVDLSQNQLTSLQGLDGKLTGALDVSRNATLTSLEGCPAVIEGNFGASFCGLTTLRGGPARVTASYGVMGNQLTSLEGAPVKVGETFNASQNKLRSLAGLPGDVGSQISLQQCGLTSLEGMPVELKCGLDVSRNELTSLRGMSERIEGSLGASGNKLRTLDGMAKVVNGLVDFRNNQLVSTRGIAMYMGSRVYLNDNRIKRLEDMPREIMGDLVLNNNALETTQGLPRIVRGNLDLNHNPIKDATHLPGQVNGHIDLRYARDLAHLPSAMPRDCSLIATARDRIRQGDLPHANFPPNAGNDNAWAWVSQADQRMRASASRTRRPGPGYPGY